MNDSTVVPPTPWYREVTAYQWMVLAIASAGWVFDVFEGQIIVSVKDPMLTALGPANREELFDMALATFLLGGTAGGVCFGMLADRWGRGRVMGLTILMYSVFTGLTAFVQEGWQLVALRFLVGMGVGGEWSVATAAVAEVFPPRARAGAAGIFHASSVLGTFLAVGAAFVVLPYANGWRIAFLLGVLPALLVAWIRISMRETESWHAAKRLAEQDAKQRLGNVPRSVRHPATMRPHAARRGSGDHRPGDVLGRTHPRQGSARRRRGRGREPAV